LPDYELEGWTTTLPAKFGMQEVIDLYKDHATHEQLYAWHVSPVWCGRFCAV